MRNGNKGHNQASNKDSSSRRGGAFIQLEAQNKEKVVTRHKGTIGHKDFQAFQTIEKRTRPSDRWKTGLLKKEGGGGWRRVAMALLGNVIRQNIESIAAPPQVS